jgi:dTDP-4-amino-4,6-dideoxygalactose transaminase
MTSPTERVPLAKPVIGVEEQAAVQTVLESGNLAQGATVAEFESEFAKAVSSEFAVAVNSGTSALHLMMLAAGIGPGDEVIVPSFSFAATANVVALTGATPVFADIELEGYSITEESISRVATSKTKAVMPVHLYGQPARINEIMSLCRSQSWILLEDAAQAHLASTESGLVGTFGVAAGFSFYPTKNMTTGEGGAVTTSDPEIARYLRLLRNQGMETRYENEIVGLNNRMTNIAAAIGLVQLGKLEGWTVKREANADFLQNSISQDGRFQLPYNRPGERHVYHQFTIQVLEGNRKDFQNHLDSRGIDTAVYYPNPIHTLKSFRESQVELPNTELAANRVVSLPIHPSLSQGDLERIVTAVNSFAPRKGGKDA